MGKNICLDTFYDILCSFHCHKIKLIFKLETKDKSIVTRLFCRREYAWFWRCRWRGSYFLYSPAPALLTLVCSKLPSWRTFSSIVSRLHPLKKVSSLTLHYDVWSGRFVWSYFIQTGSFSITRLQFLKWKAIVVFSFYVYIFKIWTVKIYKTIFVVDYIIQ